jgi:hypothetical protein
MPVKAALTLVTLAGAVRRLDFLRFFRYHVPMISGGGITFSDNPDRA